MGQGLGIYAVWLSGLGGRFRGHELIVADLAKISPNAIKNHLTAVQRYKTAIIVITRWLTAHSLQLKRDRIDRAYREKMFGHPIMKRLKHPLAATPLAVAAVVLLTMLALRISTAASTTETTSENTPTAAAATGDSPRVVLQTNLGNITLELDARNAPASVENFLGYVQDNFYDGTIFHRVIDGFMIQGGGFTTAFQKKPTKAPIRNEANNGLKNRRYTIAMARTNAPHSATAQFFINTVDNDPLDHTAATARGWGYAVFGKVVDGMDVVDGISGTLTGPGGPFSRDAPQKQIVIEKALLEVAEEAGADKEANPAKTE